MRIDLHNFFQHFDPNNPKHVAAVEQLEVDLISKEPDLLEDTSNWVRIFRTKLSVTGALSVPFYPQTDNYRDAQRTCNSSSCAMCLEYFKPGTLQGPKGDDAMFKKYLLLVIQQITPSKQKFWRAMELSHDLVTILGFLILIVSLPLADLSLLVSIIGVLYLHLLVGTWLW